MAENSMVHAQDAVVDRLVELGIQVVQICNGVAGLMAGMGLPPQVGQGHEADRGAHAPALQMEEWQKQVEERAVQGIAHDMLTAIFDRHAEA